MTVPWSGTFINLDRSIDRRRGVDSELAKAGLAYPRFSAIDGAAYPQSSKLAPGVVGCFRSHHLALVRAPRDGRFVHVLEDDAVLAKEFVPALVSVIATHRLDQFDVVFTDIIVPADLQLIKVLKNWFEIYARDRTLQLLDLKDVDFVGMSSYLVNPRSLDRVIHLFETEIARGPTLPVDIYLRRLVHANTLKAACLVPFLSTVSGGATTIDERNTKGIDVVSMAFRQAFFVDLDVAAAKRMVRQGMKAAGPTAFDPRLDLLTDALRFYVSEKYRPR